MTKTLWNIAAAVALSGAAVASQAQPATTTTAPTNVGVSQGTAADAATKAVPRPDTATLVRTAPNASDRTKAAVDNTSNAQSPTAAPASAGSGMAAPAPVQRARKADRN